MNLRQSLAWQGAALVTTIIVSALAKPQLSGRVPIHWGIDGKPDGWGSPAMALWMGPGLVLFTIGLTLAIPWLPKGQAVARFPDAYGKMMAIIGAMMAFIHLCIIFATIRGSDMPSLMFGGMFLFFVAMGNMMGKIKPNPYMGIRTPWTMKSERVWEVSHRRAGWIYVVGGLVGALLVFAGIPLGVSIAWMMIFSIYPVLDSYLVSKRIG